MIIDVGKQQKGTVHHAKKGQQFCPMESGHKSGMALYPSIITKRGLSWDDHRIGIVSGMALYLFAV